MIYNIHNLSYQGIFGHRVLEIAGIDSHGFIAHPDVSTGLNEVVSMMGRGIIFADIIVTVSPTYAREILTPAHGEGLHPLLRDRAPPADRHPQWHRHGPLRPRPGCRPDR